jgi:predicted RNA-binding Zn ribbon-like protein
MDKNIEFIGGSLWVDFLNTIRMEDGVLVDFLEDIDLMSKWLSFHQVNVSTDLKKQREDLMRLRKPLQELLNNHENPDSLTSILQELNQFLKSKQMYWNLEIKEGKLVRVIKALNQDQTGAIQILEDFFQTVENIDFSRVRQCAHHECVLYFIDFSKGGRRRWCSMETCGNKHKASTHYQKVKGKKWNN